ncbi:hypothetical protein EJ08DRAFT_665824 [Tothia fuscella]|uniref:Uncharacterized protein n=1 Tax=Tothia fuscella TaxID=1048955 RepID=A0A9P4TSZ1_9PEZI|nr:hypothetical protein EJ08DRAFT_665824 [Tothia fuscella]
MSTQTSIAANSSFPEYLKTLDKYDEQYYDDRHEASMIIWRNVLSSPFPYDQGFWISCRRHARPTFARFDINLRKKSVPAGGTSNQSIILILVRSPHDSNQAAAILLDIAHHLPNTLGAEVDQVAIACGLEIRLFHYPKPQPGEASHPKGILVRCNSFGQSIDVEGEGRPGLYKKWDSTMYQPMEGKTGSALEWSVSGKVANGERVIYNLRDKGDRKRVDAFLEGREGMEIKVGKDKE